MTANQPATAAAMVKKVNNNVDLGIEGRTQTNFNITKTWMGNLMEEKGEDFRGRNAYSVGPM